MRANTKQLISSFVFFACVRSASAQESATSSAAPSQSSDESPAPARREEATTTSSTTETIEMTAAEAAETHRVRSDEIVEINVTATRRETRLQETAVAVTALDDQTLQRQQMSDLKSVTELVPNLQVGQHSDSAAVDVALRGIVSTNRTELGDPAVAFHIDGFYSPRPQGATELLFDVERLEVLRGPQGTLFGRNSNAGVINVITHRPDFKHSTASLDFTGGNYQLYRAQGHLNVPLAPNLAIRGAAVGESRDGYIDFQRGSEVAPGTDKYDNARRAGFRLSGLYEPMKNLQLFISGEHFLDQGAGTIPIREEPLPGTSRRSALIDSPGELDLKNTTLHGTLTYGATDWLELVYGGAYGRMTRSNVSDNDVGFGAATHFQQEHRTNDSKFLSQSHEIQIRTVKTQPIDVLVGGFYYAEHNDIRFDIDINDDPNGDNIPDQYWAMSFIQPDRELSSVAGFGQVTGHVLDTLRFTLGGRYTSDTKSDVGGRNLVCPNFGVSRDAGGVNLRFMDQVPLSSNIFEPTPHPDRTCGSFPGNTGNDVEKTWSRFTWMARGEFDLLPKQVLLYGLVSTGFKSGVIQDGGITADPESVINYELGAKTFLLDRRLTWNTVGFVSDYTDILRSRAELQADGSQQLVTRNATAALIFGVETEFQWLITADDRLQLTASYLNARYKDFPTIDNVLYATNDPASPIVNLKDYKLPFSPEVSGALAFEHVVGFDNGAALIPRIQFQFQSAMFLNDFNRASDRQAAYTRTDLSIRYETDDGWLAELFVRNIEDRMVKSNVEIKGNAPGAGGMAGDPGIAYAYYDPPRTFGARVAYTWGN